MEQIFSTAILTSVLTLTLLEVVLGVDNIIFISIISSKLPKEQRKRANNIGLILAMIIRIALLFVLSFILGLQKELFNLQDIGIPIDLGLTGKDLILLAGGLFLIYKSTSEIHQKLEGEEEKVSSGKQKSTFSGAIFDILIVNLVFSVDSIITAIGMTDNVGVMAASIVLSTFIMLVSASQISAFVDKHPTIKMLALSFLVMIGTLLVAEAFGVHVPKGYIYFAMAFSLFVETLNIRMRKNSTEPVELHKQMK